MEDGVWRWSERGVLFSIEMNRLAFEVVNRDNSIERSRLIDGMRIDVNNGELVVGERSFGRVVRGDRVHLDGDLVIVNSEVRGSL